MKYNRHLSTYMLFLCTCIKIRFVVRLSVSILQSLHLLLLELRNVIISRDYIQLQGFVRMVLFYCCLL